MFDDYFHIWIFCIYSTISLPPPYVPSSFLSLVLTMNSKLIGSMFLFCTSCLDKPTPYLSIPVTDSKVTSAVWGPLDETLITGHENGTITKWDAKVNNLCSKMNINICYHSFILLLNFLRRGGGKDFCFKCAFRFFRYNFCLFFFYLFFSCISCCFIRLFKSTRKSTLTL